MNDAMLNEAGASTEGLPTFAAPKGSFSSVNSPMQNEVGIEPKSLPTFLTFKRFAARVDSAVQDEACTVCKGSPTPTALIGLFPCVASVMSTEV